MDWSSFQALVDSASNAWQDSAAQSLESLETLESRCFQVPFLALALCVLGRSQEVRRLGAGSFMSFMSHYVGI